MPAPAANNGADSVRPVRAALMLRVSTREQVKGYGLGIQETAGRAYIDARPGWTYSPEHVYRDEGVSGAAVARPGMLRLERAARQGLVDVVVVHSLDRIGRTGRAFWAWVWALEDLGVGFVSVTQDIDTADESGRRRMQLYALAAEAERDLVRERTQCGRHHRALDGGWVGGPPPWGYAIARTGPRGSALVVDEVEAEVVCAAVGFIVDDSNNVSEAARRLNGLGLLTRSGRPWTASNLHRRLRCSALLQGEVVFRKPPGRTRNATRLNQEGVPVYGESVSVPVPRIITTERAEALVRSMHAGGRSTRAAAVGYPLTGRIAGTCGHRYVGSIKKDNGTRYYRCGGANNGKGGQTNCSDPLLTADDVEAVVWKRIELLLGDPRVRAALMQTESHRHPGDIEKQRERVSRFEASLKEKEEALAGARAALIGVPGLDPALKDAAVRQFAEDARSTEALLGRAREVLADQEEAEAAEKSVVFRSLVAGSLPSADIAEMAMVTALLDIAVSPLGRVRKRSGVKCKVTEWHEREGVMVPAEVSESEWAAVEEVVAAYFARPQFVRGAVDVRTQLNGALHRLRTGCLWDQLPERYGPWQAVKERQNNWFKKGFWPVLMENLNRGGTATPVRREPHVPPLKITASIVDGLSKPDTPSTL
ncbi:recombinase family protein [Streptomyces sp. NPDC049936]|uniref:recombinase family protein n=1 Tax=Streptomyces sp. NPDC049936 TaxID=3365599 RepID=UPI00378AD050